MPALHCIRLIATLALIGWSTTLPGRALGDTVVRLSFVWADEEQAGGAPLPVPEVQASDLLGQASVAVAPDSAAEAAAPSVVVTVPADAFNGPYARLRFVVGGLSLPEADSKSDVDIRFAFELVLRQDRLEGDVALTVPVATSSRRGAMKPHLDMPGLAEDLPGRFFLAQQYMAIYAASPDAVEASPKSFALQRLIARAIADFAIAMADVRPGPVLVVPSEELKQVLELYWDRQPKGRALHLAAYADARTILWRDLRQTEEALQDARRAGVEAVSHCERARDLIAFFESHPPAEAEARKVDLMFPNPGSLAEYLAGRKLDLGFVCSRLRI